MDQKRLIITFSILLIVAGGCLPEKNSNGTAKDEPITAVNLEVVVDKNLVSSVTTATFTIVSSTGAVTAELISGGGTFDESTSTYTPELVPGESGSVAVRFRDLYTSAVTVLSIVEYYTLHVSVAQESITVEPSMSEAVVAIDGWGEKTCINLVGPGTWSPNPPGLDGCTYTAASSQEPTGGGDTPEATAEIHDEDGNVVLISIYVSDPAD